MYEHLSSEPDSPGQDVRDAVHRRAGRLRQRRLLAAGTAVTTVAGIALVLTLTGGGSPTSVLVADPPTADPTTTSEPTVAPDPTVTAEATATVEPSPSPTPTRPAIVHPSPVSPTATPTPSPTCASGQFNNCPDGRPGWSYGFSSSCHDATASDVPAAREELFDGVTATWVLSRTTAEGGQSLAGKVLVQSTRQDHVVFDVQFGADPDPAVYGGGRGGAVHVNELGRPGPHVDLLPGQTQTFDLGVGTTSCADTSDLPEPPLPPGSYAAGKTLAFDRATTVASNSETATPKPGQTPSAATTPRDGPVPPRGQFAVHQQMTLT